MRMLITFPQYWVLQNAVVRPMSPYNPYGKYILQLLMKQITSWTLIHTSNAVQLIIFQKFHGPILTLFGYLAAQ